MQWIHGVITMMLMCSAALVQAQVVSPFAGSELHGAGSEIQLGGVFMDERMMITFRIGSQWSWRSMESHSATILRLLPDGKKPLQHQTRKPLHQMQRIHGHRDFFCLRGRDPVHRACR
jgi:hypothetical protein